MPLEPDDVLHILYPGNSEGRSRRFTQDTPILPDVWIAYAKDLSEPQELLMSPHKSCTSAKLAQDLARRLARDVRPNKQGSGRQGGLHLTFNDSHVWVKLTFAQLIRVALPMSYWWKRELSHEHVSVAALEGLAKRRDLVDLLMQPARQDDEGKFPENVLNLIRIVGAIVVNRKMPSLKDEKALKPYVQEVVKAVEGLVRNLDLRDLEGVCSIWNIFTNRKATAALSQSRLTVKADAATQLFKINCSQIQFAVVDSGIDATHSAFRRDPAKPVAQDPGTAAGDSRITKTLDFTRLTTLMAVDVTSVDNAAPARKKNTRELKGITQSQKDEIRSDMFVRVRDGRPLPWDRLASALEVKVEKYDVPINEHGTHVAGIIGGNWPDHKSTAGDVEPLIGMCPDIGLYDLRVLDENGTGDEFCILAALQYVRYLNQSRGRIVIHGVNLSISIPHEASSFACGQTPICEEVERLAANGVVVVAAAGNAGYGGLGIAAANDYRDISITDPGNADAAITVGSTHGAKPHRFGVSYFSSRGPTGDGRPKPDLVAPGEQIRSCIPGEKSVVLDGTSMAAPHVSGAAALLMARHSELVGDPARVKTTLCSTATDLNRKRDFQGAGLLDVLRALQSI